MKVSLAPTGLWADLHGSVAELNSVTELLDDWAGSLTVKGAARTVYMQKGSGLQVLRGALALLLDRGMICGAAPTCSQPELLEHLAGYLVDRDLVRDYQAEAAVCALHAPFGCGLVEVAMGGGKTWISALIAVLGAALGQRRWLYLVQNKELAQQSLQSFRQTVPKLSAALAELGNEAGLQVRREPVVLDATTYGGVKNLSRKDYDGVLVDECHLLPAPTRCLPYASVKAEQRIGLSGTPLDRQDGGNPLVIGLLGPVVFSITIDQLESRGFLSKGRVQPVLYNNQRVPYR